MKHKIINIGDLHLGYGNNIDLFEEFVNKVLLPNCDENTILIFDGDQFETSHADILLLTRVVNIFKIIHDKIYAAYFLIGNHDTHLLENISTNMSVIFSVFPKFSVLENDIITINNKLFHFLSFHKDITIIRKSISESNANYLILHDEINSFFYDKFRPINCGIGMDELKKFEIVFNGHIHKRQVLDNVYIAGSPYQSKYNDCGNICGIHILDTETNEVEFIENIHYPKFHKIQYEDLLNEDFNKNLLENCNVWVVGSKDDNAVQSMMNDIGVTTLRIGTLVINNDIAETIEYEHKEDVTEYISDYLDTIKEITIPNKVIVLNKKVKENLLIKSNEL